MSLGGNEEEESRFQADGLHRLADKSPPCDYQPPQNHEPCSGKDERHHSRRKHVQVTMFDLAADYCVEFCETELTAY